MKWCDLFPTVEPIFLLEILPKQLLTLCTGASNLTPLLKARLWF